jgi:hypothetical protein
MRDLSIRILVSRGVWEPIPCRNWGTTEYGGERSFSTSVLGHFGLEDRMLAVLLVSSRWPQHCPSIKVCVQPKVNTVGRSGNTLFLLTRWSIGWHLETWISRFSPTIPELMSNSLRLNYAMWFRLTSCFLSRSLEFGYVLDRRYLHDEPTV